MNITDSDDVRKSITCMHVLVAHFNVANFNTIVWKKFFYKRCASKYFAQLCLGDVKSKLIAQ